MNIDITQEKESEFDSSDDEYILNSKKRSFQLSAETTKATATHVTI